MERLFAEKEDCNCPNCGKEMYALPDTLILTYVCPKCGCSFDTESNEFKYRNRGSSNDHDKFTKNSSNNEEFIYFIFNKNFMKKYTKYDNLMDFINAGQLIPEKISQLNYEIFKKISKNKLDKYIKNTTVFNSWEDMFEKASSRYLKI
jgi:hypothetical protein